MAAKKKATLSTKKKASKKTSKKKAKKSVKKTTRAVKKQATASTLVKKKNTHKKARKKTSKKAKAQVTQKSLLGKKIKDVSVLLTDGSENSLSGLLGKKGLVVYFYPKDSTPGCTTEACGFRDHLPELKKAGYAVVGVSADSIKSHQKFTEKQKLNFPLISDPDLHLCKAFESYGLKKFMGREYMGILRKTFVLDRALRVILEYPKVKVKEHAQDILSDIGALGVS